VIVSRAGISLPQQVKRICSGMPIAAISQSGLLPLKIREPVSSRKCAKFLTMVWTACRYELFVVGAPWIFKSHIFCLKTLKGVSFYLKSKFPLNLKIKYQQFNAKGRLFDWKPLSTSVSFCCTLSIIHGFILFIFFPPIHIRRYFHPPGEVRTYFRIHTDRLYSSIFTVLKGTTIKLCFKKW
jgi:hypothetical protein